MNWSRVKCWLVHFGTKKNHIFWGGQASRVYHLHPIIHLTSTANLFSCFQLNIVHPIFFNDSKLDVMSVVVKLTTGSFFLAAIHRDHIISNKSNYCSFANGYFIIVHNKTILKKFDMNMFMIKCGVLLNISL